MTATNGRPVDGAARPTAPGAARHDTVAAVVGQWQTVHPDLDTGPMEIIGRINRCAALLQQAEDAPLRRAGLSRPEFDLLGALRRTGRELTPSELTRETFSSGAAVTKRLKLLTERGLVERRGDTRDRRVAHVRLTDSRPRPRRRDPARAARLRDDRAHAAWTPPDRANSPPCSASCWSSWKADWACCASEPPYTGADGPLTRVA